MTNSEDRQGQQQALRLPSPPKSTSTSTSNSPKSNSQTPSQSMPISALTPPFSPPNPTQPSDISIVIAHYNEDLTWLNPFASSCHIYSKGDPPATISTTEPISSEPSYRTVTCLPNIGHETHSYLTYITTHYSTLPPCLLLLQGDIHTINHGTPAHTDLTLSEIINLTTQLAPGAVLPIGLVKTFSGTDEWDALFYKQGWVERRGKTLKRSKLTPGEFWRFMFDGEDGRGSDMPEGRLPSRVRFVQGACFGVTRQAILRRPKSFYERVLKYFEELGEVNPEEGHYMERFWYAVLSDGAIDEEEGGAGGEEEKTGADGDNPGVG